VLLFSGSPPWDGYGAGKSDSPRRLFATELVGNYLAVQSILDTRLFFSHHLSRFYTACMASSELRLLVTVCVTDVEDYSWMHLLRIQSNLMNVFLIVELLILPVLHSLIIFRTPSTQSSLDG